MHSIELLLDTASDAAVRQEWRTLSAAGLPSQGDHAGVSNAPHVTLVARPRLDSSGDPRLRSLARSLPLPGELGALLLFGAPPRGLVLVRPVVPSLALLELHRDVHASAGGAGGVPHAAPGRWTPHVTLASRLSPEQVARALDALADGGSPGQRPVTIETMRRWDPDSREVVDLSAPDADGG